jgi:hypothetical protein
MTGSSIFFVLEGEVRSYLTTLTRIPLKALP